MNKIQVITFKISYQRLKEKLKFSLYYKNFAKLF